MQLQTITLVLSMPGNMVFLTWGLSLSQHLPALFRLKLILGVSLCFIFKLSVKSQCLTQNSVKKKGNHLYISILNHQGEHGKAFLLHVVKTVFTEFCKGQK